MEVFLQFNILRDFAVLLQYLLPPTMQPDGEDKQGSELISFFFENILNLILTSSKIKVLLLVKHSNSLTTKYIPYSKHFNQLFGSLV